MSYELSHEAEETLLREALTLIKIHITEKPTRQSKDLHAAVQKIVDVARNRGLLLEHGGR